MEDDHMPLKDEFSKDQSDIEIDDKDEEPCYFQSGTSKNKKLKKKNKNFSWKYRWVKIANSVEGSDPILVRRWVRIKNGIVESDNEEEKKSDFKGEEGNREDKDYKEDALRNL